LKVKSFPLNLKRIPLKGIGSEVLVAHLIKILKYMEGKSSKINRDLIKILFMKSQILDIKSKFFRYYRRKAGKKEGKKAIIPDRPRRNHRYWHSYRNL